MARGSPGRNATPTLEEARRRRADLHRALVEVEQAISGPAAGRLREWTDRVTRRLRQLGHALEDHVAVTERPGGLYEEITAQAPHLAEKVRRVGAEHAVLRESVSRLLDRLESTPVGDAWPLQDARADVQRLLGRIVRHRQVGADLVWEAYSVDIGSGD
ncbi:MAG TPA: hypothetical protein VKW76_05275 [Candidatus Binatia bacterium]|nr:hypothetical protein [Candidatus Binatia bacterium]